MRGSSTAPPPAAHLPFLADAAVRPIRPRRKQATSRAPLPNRPPSVDPRPTVSVVLGSYNRRVQLERAIESVRANLGGLRGEIIVVDGGSDDGSAEWLIQQNDIISIIQHNRYENQGETRRRMSWGRFMNIGFRAAGADRIVMISDDCYLLPSAIAKSLRRIDEAKAVGLSVGACAYYFRNWPSEDRYYVQRTLGGNLMVNHGVFTREALEAANYANEDDYAFYKADSDLSLKIWQAGFAIIDSPESVCEHLLTPAEAARVSNTATMDFDRQQLRVLWRELLGRTATQKMGPKFLDWIDPQRTAERVFGDQIAAPANGQDIPNGLRASQHGARSSAALPG